MSLLGRRFSWAAGMTLATVCISSSVQAVSLYSENFESVTLGPTVTFETELADLEAWSADGPAGWTVDRSLIPGLGDPAFGVTEFEGWTFLDKDWYVSTTGDQRRGEFLAGFGVIAVADSDEHDDLGTDVQTAENPFDSTLTTPAISLAGVAAGDARLTFNSSWRPEPNQKATLNVRYNGGAATELLNWTSVDTDTTFHPDTNTNETIDIALDNPAGASMELDFRLFDGTNNWFWAIDNLQVYTGTPDPNEPSLRAVIDRATQNVQILNNTGGAVDLRGYSLRSADGAFDETAASFLSDGDADWVQLTTNGGTSDLSEGHLTSSSLAGGANINLGNSWLKYFEDVSDVTFEYLVAGSDETVQGVVEFTGNGGLTYSFLDLNFDGSIDIGDWEAFKAGVGTPLDGLSVVQAYQVGDLDLNGAHTLQDFLAFKSEFDQANGAGAFAAMASAVPEPSALMLSLMAAATCLLPRRRTSNAWVQRWQPSISRLAVVGAAMLVMLLGSVDRAAAQLVLLDENFDGLAYGPNQEEQPDADNVWTNVPPAGWVKDDTGVPGYMNAADNNGVTEWIGWTFADRDWWVEAAGDQDRSQFTNASGGVMIADPDEWDDAAHPGGPGDPVVNTTPDAPGTIEGNWYDAFISTPSISLAGAPANTVQLSFDSSWRDEFDTNFHQAGTLNVAFDGGEPTQVLRYDSDPESAFFKDDTPNENVTLALNNPEGASEMVLTWGLIDAGNDWWWAVDNVLAFVPADPSILRVNQDEGWAEIVAGDSIAVPINAYEVRASLENGLTGANLTGLTASAAGDTVDGPDADSTPGNSPGEQWEVLNAGNEQVFEAHLFGSSTFSTDGGAGTTNAALGQIWNTGVGDTDLEFVYTTVFGNEVAGVVEFCSTGAGCPTGMSMSPVVGDLNGDGVVNFGDLSPFVLGLTNVPAYDAAFPELASTRIQRGDVSQDTNFNFGDLSPFVNLLTNGSGSGAQAVPEPTSMSLFLLAGLAMLLPRWSGRLPCARLSGLAAALLATLMVVDTASADVSVDRLYQLGDAAGEGGADGIQVGSGNGFNVSFVESGGQGASTFADLSPSSTRPAYAAISGRPDGGTGLGVQFGTGTFLRAPNLNWPEETFTSTTQGGPKDYLNIDDRGLQFWARTPGTVEAGTLISDGGQHGVKLDADGVWQMDYAGALTPAVDGFAAATPNTWYHLMVVRPSGPGGGSRLYVDGVAAAAVSGDYSGTFGTDPEPLLGVGAVVASTQFGFTGSDFFKGIIDDLEMFVLGFNSSANYGQFDPGTDNGYIAAFAPSNPVDLTGDGNINSADVDAFVAGWLNTKVINGIQVGDLETRMSGDFNYDGTTDLTDWGLLNAASPAAGAAALAAINGVPEPATCVLLLIALSVMPRLRFRLS